MVDILEGHCGEYLFKYIKARWISSPNYEIVAYKLAKKLAREICSEKYNQSVVATM